MRPIVRLLLICVILASVVTLGIHYYVAGPDYPYPSPGQIATDTDEYLGTELFLFATVESVDQEQNSARIRVALPGEDLELTVSGFDARNVQPGGRVQVYGTLESSDRIDAKNVVVVTSTATTDRNKYLLSGVGAILVLVVFFRYWTIDTDELGFTPR